MGSAPLRVVLVDDDDGLAALLAEHLLLDGRFELTGRARDGMEAIRLVAQVAPDVVVMDLHMPVLGGVAATQALVKANPQACVIVFTASNDPSEHEAARLAGAVAVLAKPFDPAAFLDGVEHHATGCAQAQVA